MRSHASHHRHEHVNFLRRLADLSDRQLSLFMLILAGAICTALMLVDRSLFG